MNEILTAVRLKTSDTIFDNNLESMLYETNLQLS